jgi:hypothetical protein
VIYFHPRRGAVITDQPLNPRCLRYRGGRDSDWRVVREPLPEGFLYGDPARQHFGMGGPELVFGPLEKTCRACKRPFVFPAAAQKRLLEERRAYVDATGVYCLACTRSRNRTRKAKRAYDTAITAADEEPSAERLLAAAKAALVLIRAGGRAPIDQAIANARNAERTGACGAAAVLAALRALLRTIHAG